MSGKKQLLDPIGTICKLVTLKFNPLKTKICIRDHVLTMQPPSTIQFAVRTYWGDDREIIGDLYYVIVYIIEWYLMPRHTTHIVEQPQVDIGQDYEFDDYNSNKPVTIIPIYTNAQQIANSDAIRKIAKYLCVALEKLQKTYATSGIVVFALQYYINIINDGLAGTYSSDKLPEHLFEKSDKFENLLDYEKIKNLWDIEKLERICKLFDDGFSNIDDPRLSEQMKDLLNVTYLKSIESILQITDNDFQYLISNNMKG